MKLRIILNIENLYKSSKWQEHNSYNQPLDKKPSMFIIFLLELLEEYDVYIYHSKSINPYHRYMMTEWFREELFIFLRDLKHITTILSRKDILERINYRSRWFTSEESERWVNVIMGSIKWPWFEPNHKRADTIGWLDIKDIYAKQPDMRQIFMSISYDYVIRGKFCSLFEEYVDNITEKIYLRDLIQSCTLKEDEVITDNCDGC